MIYDKDTEVTVSAPGAGVSLTYSNSYDLKGGSDGVPQLFGGDQLYMQFEVTTAFSIDTGAPLAQFGIAIDDTSTLGASSNVLALTGGSIATKVGFTAAQLTLGRTFHLAIPPWEDIMVSDSGLWPNDKDVAHETAFRLFRYVGIVIHNPIEVAGADHFFAGGAVKARICTYAGLGTAVHSNIYPSRMEVL